MQKTKIIILFSAILMVLNISATKLYDAVKRGNVTQVKKLVEEEGVDVKKDPKSVIAAFDSEDNEIFKYLIKKGADVNIDCGDDKSFLHKAAHKGDLEIVKVLVENGANLVLRNQYGETPLDLVRTAYGTRFEPFNGGSHLLEDGTECLFVPTFNGPDHFKEIEERNKPILAVLKYLEKLEEEAFDAFIKAAKLNNIKDISCLLDKKLTFDYTKDGKNLLHIVASILNISLAVVKVVVEKGVNVDERDYSFKTPIYDFVYYKQNSDIIRYLLKKSKKLDAKTVEMLAKEKLLFDKNDICPICIDELKDKESIAFLLKCKHMFCKTCIEQWQASKITNEDPACPVCRKTFTSNDIMILL